MGKKRKTKEQKIISELRRKLYLTEMAELEHQPVPKQTYPQATIRLDQIKISKASSPKITSVKLQDYSYLYRDLRKSVGLTGLAILFQVMLYLALR